MGKFDEIVADFQKDAAKENSGVWMTYGKFQYRIARAHRDNTAHKKLMEEKMRPYQWAIDRGNTAALKGVALTVMQEVYAETILLGIRRVSGEDMAYVPADGVGLFAQLPDLWDEVFRFANAGENYTPDQVKDDSGNSQPS